MRFYFWNSSYPELRGVTSTRERHLIWWRSFRYVVRDRRVLLLVFVLWGGVLVINMVGWRIISRLDGEARAWDRARAAATGALVVAGPDNVSNDRNWWRIAAVGSRLGLVLTFFAWALIPSLTIAGELVRPHLRRADIRCRRACPECGYDLARHLVDAGIDTEVPSVPVMHGNAGGGNGRSSGCDESHDDGDGGLNSVESAVEKRVSDRVEKLKANGESAEETERDGEVCRVRCPECGLRWPETAFREPFSGLTLSSHRRVTG